MSKNCTDIIFALYIPNIQSSKAAGKATKYCPATGTDAKNVATKTGTVMILALNTV